MRASACSLLFIALLLPATGSAAPAFTLRTCFENSDSYPWLLQSGEGLCNITSRRLLPLLMPRSC